MEHDRQMAAHEAAVEDAAMHAAPGSTVLVVSGSTQEDFFSVPPNPYYVNPSVPKTEDDKPPSYEAALQIESHRQQQRY